MTTRAVAIVVAAGTGRRLSAGAPKAFVPVGGVPMLVRSVRAALASPSISSVVVAAPRGDESAAASMLAGVDGVTIVTGGASRHASVRACLDAVDAEVETVVVHDAARPFAPPSMFTAVVEALIDGDGCVPVVPLTDTVKRVRDGSVISTEDRDELAAAQTPQSFRARALRDAHARAEAEGREFTDDAAALEWAGYRVRAVDGHPSNVKITTTEDLSRAEDVLRTVAG